MTADTVISDRHDHHRIRHIVVVVPAHNEQDLLDACLTALTRAQCRVLELATVSTIVVLDACTDESAREVARHPSVSVVEVDHRNVGAARAAGFTDGLRPAGPLAATWFATTDADTRVSEDWLLGHLRHAAEGACALAGTVSVEFEGLTNQDHTLKPLYDAHYRYEFGHPHVHGANLGVRATDYLAVGGFAPLATGEDHDLVRRLELDGTRCRRVCDIPVTTSGRLHGRAPEGMAGFLRSLEPTA